ncbi:MAG: hypothetical protein EXR72_12405 [Myxococcales bacterium]|nr:hypothetical protein [Myxococcales bacterium]
MPFPWQNSTRTAPRGRAAMYRRELEERAALLFRLGYAQPRARARLVANVAWDFEIGGGGPAAQEIDAIVEAVYRRGGLRSGAPTV